jgi:hypothetical protein
MPVFPRRLALRRVPNDHRLSLQDPSPNAPMTPIETARTSKEYLKKLGFTFLS